MSTTLLIKDRKGKTFVKGDLAVITPDPNYSQRALEVMLIAAVKGSQTNTYTVTFLPLLEPYHNLLKEQDGQDVDYFMEAPKLINATKLQFIKVDKPSTLLEEWQLTLYNQMLALL